jgi:hypothetical protein
LLVCPLPEGVTERAGASAAVGAIALQGVRQAQIDIGSVVVVVGLGLIGLLTVQVARAAGAVVIGVDPVPDRRAQAMQLGARITATPDDAGLIVRELTRGLGADRVIITAATKSNEPLLRALDWARNRGVVVVVGDVGLALTRSPFYEKELELRIACSYGPGRYDPGYEREGRDYPAPYVRWTENRNMESYLELLRSGAVDWDALASREMPMENAGEAFEALNQPGSGRPLAVMLRFPSTGDVVEPPRRGGDAVKGVRVLASIEDQQTELEGTLPVTRLDRLQHLAAMWRLCHPANHARQMLAAAPTRAVGRSGSRRASVRIAPHSSGGRGRAGRRPPETRACG